MHLSIPILGGSLSFIAGAGAGFKGHNSRQLHARARARRETRV